MNQHCVDSEPALSVAMKDSPAQSVPRGIFQPARGLQNRPANKSIFPLHVLFG